MLMTHKYVGALHKKGLCLSWKQCRCKKDI